MKISRNLKFTIEDNVKYKDGNQASIIFNMKDGLLAASLEEHNKFQPSDIKIAPEKLFFINSNFYFYEEQSRDVKALIGPFELTDKNAIVTIHSMGDIIKRMEVVELDYREQFSIVDEAKFVKMFYLKSEEKKIENSEDKKVVYSLLQINEYYVNETFGKEEI